MLNVLRASINLTLRSLNNIELVTLCNLATAKFEPKKSHHGYDKWIGLFGAARTILDQDVLDLILDEVSTREDVMKYS